MYELKTCPFCGGYAEFQQTAYGTTEGNSVKLSFQVICKKCDATAPKSYGSVNINFSSDGLLNIWHDDREQAVKEWNRRAEDGGQDVCD